jgi:hypothetical protein
MVDIEERRESHRGGEAFKDLETFYDWLEAHYNLDAREIKKVRYEVECSITGGFVRVEIADIVLEIYPRYVLHGYEGAEYVNIQSNYKQ